MLFLFFLHSILTYTERKNSYLEKKKFFYEFEADTPPPSNYNKKLDLTSRYVLSIRCLEKFKSVWEIY